MCCVVICFFFIYIVGYVTAEDVVVSYEGAQVWRTNLRSAQDAQVFQSLADQQAISIWNLNTRFVDFLIQPEDQRHVSRVLDVQGLQASTVLEDVQWAIDESTPEPSVWNEKALRNGHRLDWNSYPTLPVIEEYLQYLANKFPSLCRITTIGHSVENRSIHMITISNGNKRNKVFLMTAGIHAREWIAITSALYLIDTIAMNFHQLPDYMKSIDWHIIPVLNPDGYVYTYTKDRLWRKNRNKTKDLKCLGVDLNRNFGFNWYLPSLAHNSCVSFQQYSGPRPFSEPETQAIRDLITKWKKIPDAFVDLHSYGQLILYPWGSKPDLHENHDALNATATAMSQAIFNTTRTKYIVGDAYNTMYPTSGLQIDWFYSLGVNYVFIFELRDALGSRRYTRRGFLLPPEKIEPTGKDVVTAMGQLADTLAKLSKKEQHDKVHARNTDKKKVYTATVTEISSEENEGKQPAKVDTEESGKPEFDNDTIGAEFNFNFSFNIAGWRPTIGRRSGSHHTNASPKPVKIFLF